MQQTNDRRITSSLWRIYSVLGLTLCIYGCSSTLPKNTERPFSTALSNPENTTLAGLIAKIRPPTVKNDASVFTLISGPQQAFSSRMALVENAQKTLDLQYYAIHADHRTNQLLRAIVHAARRGVRVRVLLDDFHSTGPDAQVMRLAFVPNVEMRMFNPLAGSRASTIGRAWTLLTDFQRAQQRMHNKLFVADNALAVIGGRNLGDAYFDASNDGNFVDLDVLTGGPVVKDLSRSFDRYWNNVRAYPVQSLISEQELLKLKNQFEQEDSKVQTTATQVHTAEDDSAMNLRQVPWVWAHAMLLADSPAKIPSESDEGSPNSEETTLLSSIAKPGKTLATAASVLHTESVVNGLLALIRTAKQDLLVVSPYFVPGPEIMSAFRAARQQGVRIRILTNSLASNDAPLAHAGYARHRKELLALGITLHEMRSEAANLRSALRSGGSGASGSTGASRAMLHTKLLVIDGRLVVVGSMNLDMRSQHQNTEVAVIIASRSFSKMAASSIDESLPENSWRVELKPDGQLVWRAPEDSDLPDSHTEPDASLGLRLMLQLIGPLAPDSLL